MTLSETTVLIVAVVFILILIILAKLSNQLDKMSNIQKQIIRKLVENQESDKWLADLMKAKFEEIIAMLLMKPEKDEKK